MGQTLTHGIYLPDEGERNCYSGLAGNWQLLDGAVGTIAEHTTQIAGKAPAVHTHTKSDITDFPAYGNAAGTICEGNDSRLSDARTPVAHTHTKSDVTDLLNSNFIPSANNSYDLGSSSYQWNNVYSKGYYYNGVAWGLDKANTWSGENTFSAANLFRKRAFTLGDNSSQIVRMEYKDTNNSRWGILSFIQDTDNTVHCDIGVHALKTDGQTVLNKSVTLLVKPDNNSEFKPINDKAIDLGTSNNKWKSLNGVNPGALSLPDLNTAQTIDRTGWAYDGSTYNAIKLSSTDTNMTKNGWLYVRISSTGSSDKLSIKYNSIGDKYPTSSFGDTGGCIEVFVPVIANANVYLCATKDLQFCKFYPCLGNVPSGV